MTEHLSTINLIALEQQMDDPHSRLLTIDQGRSLIARCRELGAEVTALLDVAESAREMARVLTIPPDRIHGDEFVANLQYLQALAREALDRIGKIPQKEPEEGQ